ncbi:MAG: Zn-dependent hydrolase [Planctomycetota bacterium]|nr:MAG: Zn-dependent hydrolase [Planctomycetota bacterium]
MESTVDIAKLSAELEHLATFTDAPPPAVTRVMLSDTDLAAREYLMRLMEEAGLTVRIDAAGNLFARWSGTDPHLPAVATGSHTDAIPHSGRYDGTVGVLGGLEAIRSLKRSGHLPRRAIELVMFTAEEPTRYGVGCLGSRLMSGAITGRKAEKLVDGDGVSFGDFHKRAGGAGTLEEVRLPRKHFRAFVELHIEQGPRLEASETPIGIVTAIAAPASLRVTYVGAGGHAGAVLMADRRDALLPAAELAVAVDSTARNLGTTDTVATTGVLDVHPRAVNSIPSRTYLEIDVRDVNESRRNNVLDVIRHQAQAIGDRHRQETTVETINADAPATCDPQIVKVIEAAADEAQLTSSRMISRAYHDSLFMAQVCPTGMIFIPCREGLSHCPEEYASPLDIARGVQVLAATLARLSSE